MRPSAGWKRRLIPGLCLVGLLWVAPGCAAVKLAGMAGKAATAGKAAGTVAKAGSATKVVTVGKVTKAGTVVAGGAAAQDLMTVASVADDTWRLGRSVESGAELSFLSRNNAGVIRSTGSQALDGALLSADFVDWIADQEPDEGEWLAGEGAPRPVADAILEATYPANALGKAELVKGQFWMQLFRMEHGDRLVVYDTKTQKTRILVRQKKA